MQPESSGGLEVARLQAVADNADRLGLVWQLRLATVQAAPVATTDAATIIIDADTEPIQAKSMVGPLQVGMRVWVITSPPAGNHIVGLVDGKPTRLGKAVGIAYNLSSGSTTSATPVAMPGAPAVAITKYYDDTYLHFVFTCTFFATVADAGPAFSANANSGAIDIQVGRLDVANGSFNTRQQCAGQASASLPAGDYTFNGYWRRNTGGGTLFVVSDDIWTMSVEEFWP